MLKTRRVWTDNIKIDLKGVEGKNVNCVYMVQNKKKWRAVVKTRLKFGAQ